MSSAAQRAMTTISYESFVNVLLLFLFIQIDKSVYIEKVAATNTTKKKNLDFVYVPVTTKLAIAFADVADVTR